MYSSICVRGFRCFEGFFLEGLGRVNLLVGLNNCGKTSVLESVQLVSSPSPSVLAALAIRRGESQARAEGGVGPFYAIDMSHLFAGRDLAREVVVTADRSARGTGLGTATEEVRLRVGDAKSDEAWGHDSQLSVYHDAGLQEDDNELMLRASWTAAPNDFAVPLTADGELPMRSRLLRKARGNQRRCDRRRGRAGLGDSLMQRVHPRKLLVEGDTDKRVMPFPLEANGVVWEAAGQPVVHIESRDGVEEMLKPGAMEGELTAAAGDTFPRSRRRSLWKGCKWPPALALASACGSCRTTAPRECSRTSSSSSFQASRGTCSPSLGNALSKRRSAARPSSRRMQPKRTFTLGWRGKTSPASRCIKPSTTGFSIRRLRSPSHSCAGFAACSRSEAVGSQRTWADA